MNYKFMNIHGGTMTFEAKRTGYTGEHDRKSKIILTFDRFV